MTMLVGLLLIAVFLVMAGLLFFERISTLLALPLMAVSFLAVGLAGDLCIDNAGATNGRAGFAEYVAFRNFEAARLADHAMVMREAIRSAQNALDAPATRVAALLEAQLALLRETEQMELRETRILLTDLPDFFARAPLAAGAKAALLAEAASCSAVPVVESAWRAARDNAAGGGRERARSLLKDAAALAESKVNEYLVTRPDANPQSLWWGLRYCGEYFAFVLRNGSLSLFATIIATLFGGMFAMYVKSLGIAERVVYWTAEFAGERPIVVALAMYLTTAASFTSVGELGAVIMLGTIVLPVLRSIGLSPVVGAGVFLLAIATGGTLRPVSRRLWLDFYGLPPAELDRLLLVIVLAYFAVAVVWIIWGTRQSLRTSFHAVPVEKPANVDATGNATTVWLLAAPLIPVLLVFAARVDELSAFLVSITYMFLCVCRRDGAARQLVRSMIEGAQAVIPPILLMIGIGLLVTALSTPPVQGYLKPLIAAASPQTRVGYIATFALAAPLALYRGPLNVWGMGLAVSATLLSTTSLPPAAVLGAVLAAGMLQGVCDPTNTANVWIAGFQGVTVNQILRHTLAPVWIAAIIVIAMLGVWLVP